MLLVSPNRLARRDAQTSYPIGSSRGGRVELNAVLILPGHKVNTGCVVEWCRRPVYDVQQFTSIGLQ